MQFRGRTGLRGLLKVGLLQFENVTGQRHRAVNVYRSKCAVRPLRPHLWNLTTAPVSFPDRTLYTLDVIYHGLTEAHVAFWIPVHYLLFTLSLRYSSNRFPIPISISS